VTEGKIRVESPFHPDFVRQIRAAGGKWDGTRQAWVLDARTLETVREICRRVYGEDDRGSERVTLRVTFAERYTGDRAPCVLAGRTLARAWGRDSGACVGEGVSFVKGAPHSGGSVKNWLTVIPDGCVLDIFDVPMSMAQKTIDDAATVKHYDRQIYSAEIIGAAVIDRAGLEAELAALTKRMAEINEILEAAG
jgi:hypothetical protein